MSKPFTEFKVLYAAIHGYHPFNPDAGIFAGGYQGPLYPNPTTLFSPNTSFNSYLYQIPFPTPHIMKNTGDFYEGLGVGNPGINYRNPGHILGIFDTYLRMSYALNIIKSTRILSMANKFGRSVEVNIPLLGTDGATIQKILTWSDIYPSFSEEPDDYIINFVDDTGLILDPRTSEPFNFDGDKYEPNVSVIDFNVLFTGLHVFSYGGMPEKFQDYCSQLIDFAQTYLDQQEEIGLEDVPFDPFTPVTDIPRHYPFEDRLAFLEDADVEFNGTSEEFEIFPNRFGSNFKILDRTTALKSMTGNDIFHKVDENLYEYRSLTELNSVINIIPVQGYSFTFNCLTSDPDITDSSGRPPNQQKRFYVVFSLVDVIINILNLSDKSISIEGSVELEYQVPTIGFFQFGINENQNIKFPQTPAAQIQRRVFVATSHTNSFTWDRVWLGLDQFNDKTLENLSMNHDITDINSVTIIPNDILDFSKNFTLQQGNNCIRTRILGHSMGFVEGTDNAFDKIITNLTINIPDMDPIDYSFVARAGFSLYPYI